MLEKRIGKAASNDVVPALIEKNEYNPSGDWNTQS
jgi:hypothetical protein